MLEGFQIYDLARSSRIFAKMKAFCLTLEFEKLESSARGGKKELLTIQCPKSRLDNLISPYTEIP
jgi:hypothetical protein